jgi:uncharacterized membrane protein (UPF0182 family)
VSFDFPEPTRAGAEPRPRRRGALVPTLVILVVLLLGFGLFAGFWTDLLWFRSVNFSRVFTTRLGTRVAMFVVAGALFALVSVGNLVLARRFRPIYLPPTPDAAALERYQAVFEPIRRPVLIGFAIVVGLFAGSAAAGRWETWLLWRNGGTFGQRDPQFGLDTSFFVFDLPWWQFLVGYGFGLVIVSGLLAAIGHWLYGGLRPSASSGARTTEAARIHLSVILGAFVLLKAVAYWLDRYSLAVASSTVGREDFTGLRYTDVNALLPGKTILAVIAAICAVLFFATALTRSWLLPGIGAGLLVLSAVLVGGVYPAIVQYFQVRPSEVDREAPYLQRYIAGTRTAYGIADTQVRQYAARTTVSPGQLRNDAATVPGIRLLDPSVVSPTFRQLQQIRQYYSFPDSLDIDRYSIGGRQRDAVVASREIDLGSVPDAQRNWINDHLIYTHGFGFVGAYGNTVDTDGRPTFFERDIPPAGQLGTFQPRIYFGERSPEYSIVGAPQGAPPRELDYPDDHAPSGQRNITYTGSGGVPIGSLWNRTLFFTRFQEINILLSSGVNENSRILFYRAPRDRVERVAPWLTVDGDPYPAVVGGRIVWILDGYTTSNSYPYSRHTALQEATSDALTARSQAVTAQPQEQVNYIRNSVKATVDAYDGTVTLYAWDERDPVLAAWSKAFPGTVHPRSAISPELMAHLRYPEDLFKVQRSLLAQFHVTDPRAFYTGQDFWRIPADPSAERQSVDQPPYYLTLARPGAQQPAFSLTSTYVPRGNRDNLTGFISVTADPGPGYGTIQILQLPSSSTIPGPGQVQNAFEADPTVASTLSLLRQGGSTVTLGNLLSLPVGGGFLYVEPVYVSASGTAAGYPLLQRVLVAFGDRVGFAGTLQEALNQVFAGNAGAQTGETGPTAPTQPGQPSTPGPTPPGGAVSNEVAAALADARQALQDAQAALRDGDFAAYGEAQQRLAKAIDRAIAAEQKAGGRGTATPTPTPGSTPGSPGTPTTSPGATPQPAPAGATPGTALPVAAARRAGAL